MSKVEAAGIEREDAILQRVSSQELANSPAEASALCLHGDRSKCHSLAANDIELSRVIELWPSLPKSVKRTIYTFCEEADFLD